MFWNFLIGIALFFLQLVLAPKPQNAKAASLQDFNVPVAEEGLEIPVAFGTNNLKGPNVVWYGDLHIQDIKGPRRYGFFGPRQVTGHRYGLGMHMVLCHAVHDEIRQIWAGDKLIFPKAPSTAIFQGSGVLVIDQADIFGGDEGEGGISGNVHVLGGDPAQAQDTYLASVLAGAATPAFRGVVSIVWEHLYVGNTPYIKPWEFFLKRIHQTSRGEAQWYDAKAAVPDTHDDVVSPETGVQLLTSTTMNQQNKVDTYGEYAARAEQGLLWVWHLPDGGQQTGDFSTGGGGVPDPISVHVTAHAEVMIRKGGNNFGSAHSYVSFLDASDITTTTQSDIDIHSYIVAAGGTDLNWGFVSAEYNDYILLKVNPETSTGLPWILLHYSSGAWSVDSTHNGTTNSVTTISMGPTYAYAIKYGDAHYAVLVTWDSGSWNETTVHLSTLMGGNAILAMHYFAGTGEVIVVAGGGVYVFDDTLSTLLRSKTDYDQAISGASSERMAYSGSQILVFSGGATDYMYVIDVSDLSVAGTVNVTTSSLVNASGATPDQFHVNQQQGSVIIGGHSSTPLSFWPVATVDALDMNPAHIIRECLTDHTWGMGYADADIDDDSFTAAADTLWDECFGLSLLWTREERIEEFISVILAHIDAYLYLSRTTGKFTLKLIRNDYVLGDLPQFDEDDVVSWDEVSHRQPAEAINSVIVKYTDRRNRGKDASHSFDNIAQIQQLGERISATRFYPGISRGDLAVRVAERDQRSLGIGMISGRVKGKRTLDILNPGDPFRLTSSRHNLDGQVMRAVDLQFGDGRDNKITLKFVEDVFRLNARSLVDTSATDWENPINPPAVVTPRLVWEMPYLELKQMIGSTDTATLLAGDADAGMIEAAGAQPTSDTLDAAIWVDGVKEEVMGFAPAGLLDADIAAFDTAITLTDATDLDRIEVGQLAAIIGATPALTEIVKVTAVSGNDLTIGRGFLDTVPQAHSLGDAIVVFDDFGMTDFEARTAGDTPSVELLTRTLSGVLTRSLAPNDIVTLDSRAIRPLRPADAEVEGDDGSSGAVDVSAIDPFEVTWANRNRLTETTPKAWDAATVALEAGATITIALIAVDGTTIIDDTTYAGLTGTSANITQADFLGESEAFVRFTTVRDGYGPWQYYQIAVSTGVLLLLEGDMTDGDDHLKLEGDMTDGNDLLVI